MLKQIRSLFRVLKSRDDFERGMSEELRFHVEQYIADLIRAGVSLLQRLQRRARNRVRQPQQHSGRMPRSPRAPTIRRITEATPPRGTDTA